VQLHITFSSVESTFTSGRSYATGDVPVSAMLSCPTRCAPDTKDGMQGIDTCPSAVGI
jgi:hypothetical protein